MEVEDLNPAPIYLRAAAGTYYVTLADFGPFLFSNPEPKWVRLDITAP